MEEIRIRQATAADRDGILALVASAFRGDPAWTFLMAGDYERLAPRFAGALFDLRLELGGVWVSEDLATVSMWDPPGVKASESLRERVWRSYREAAGDGAWKALSAYNSALSLLAPSKPHWYLGVLASAPSRRGEGLASAVMRPAVELADSERLACCLETSKESNRRFYAGRGFVESTPVALDQGPPTWWLRRPPAPEE